MTEQHDNTSNDGPASTQSDETTSVGVVTPEGQDDGPHGPNSKEARYRIRAREAEAALTAAEARIQGYQRAEVERLAADALSQPGDLFSLSGNDLADYLNEDGSVDAEKVSADVAAVLAERPGLRKSSPAFDPTQGQGGAPPKGNQPSWADLFKS